MISEYSDLPFIHSDRFSIGFSVTSLIGVSQDRLLNAMTVEEDELYQVSLYVEPRGGGPQPTRPRVLGTSTTLIIVITSFTTFLIV